MTGTKLQRSLAFVRDRCRDCGTTHEPSAHADPETMEREAARRVEAGDALGAAIWRARAACTRAGWVLTKKGPR